MMREAVAWLDRILPLAAIFPKGSLLREDRLPVPADALRETILNAIIHRDYSLPSSYVAIAVFDDRVEIQSIGDFPTGISAEMLSQEHPSVLRNPLIAGAFHRTGAVEAWGCGTNRVIDACATHGVPPPEYVVKSGVVTVTFRIAGQKTLEKTPEAILRLLRKQPELSFRQIAAQLGKSGSAVERAIRKLRESGRLERVGPDRGGHWKVLENR